ncbi:hypothetical protein BH11BAC2_BH11BAC2_15200 [soil metagenome]
MSKLLSMLILMLTFSSKSYSQSPKKDETLAYINRMLGTSCQVDLKGGTMMVSFRDPEGKLLREDKAQIMDLEFDVNYDQEYHLLCMPCLKDVAGCVTRTLMVQKSKRETDRISIAVEDESKYKNLQKAFEHLIRLEAEHGYKDEVTLE